uniref:Uncharacterized protein n=1 Tax=Plectus sambesii TaxID=2011161 RepID=A0A914XAL3_9BILA
MRSIVISIVLATILHATLVLGGIDTLRDITGGGIYRGPGNNFGYGNVYGGSGYGGNGYGGSGYGGNGYYGGSFGGGYPGYGNPYGPTNYGNNPTYFGNGPTNYGNGPMNYGNGGFNNGAGNPYFPSPWGANNQFNYNNGNRYPY